MSHIVELRIDLLRAFCTLPDAELEHYYRAICHLVAERILARDQGNLREAAASLEPANAEFPLNAITSGILKSEIAVQTAGSWSPSNVVGNWSPGDVAVRDDCVAAVSAQCLCATADLMIRGCRCGALQAEQQQRLSQQF
jgi:hypothetical protein